MAKSVSQNTAHDTILPRHDALFQEPALRWFLGSVFALLILLQGLYLIKIGPGVSKHTDGFSEANALRAADAYIQDGLWSYHGLPRQAYGKRLHGEGVYAMIVGADGAVPLEYRLRLPARCANPDLWVYTHYPEGPDVMLALIGHVVGLENMRLLRLFPLGIGLFASAIFFITVAQRFGTGRAVFIAAGCVLLPMFHACMPGLHYQGYSLALLLLQISLLLRMYWRQTPIPKWHWAALFLFGFLQGWLSFDQFFVVGLIAWPFWLLRKSEGYTPSKLTLALCLALPVAGFGLAHCLHFLQVVGGTGSFQAAIEEFRATATERAGLHGGESGLLPMLQKTGALGGAYYLLHPFQYLLGTVENPYIRMVISSLYNYIQYFIHLGLFQFAPVFPVAAVLLLPVVLFHQFQIVLPCRARSTPIALTFCRPAGGNLLPTFGAALFTSLIWLFVMAGHTVNNGHITVRHFFVFYLFVLIALSKSVRLHRVG